MSKKLIKPKIDRLIRPPTDLIDLNPLPEDYPIVRAFIAAKDNQKELTRIIARGVKWAKQKI